MGYIRVNGLNRHRSRCWNATVCAVELGFGLSQLLGGDSWGGLQGEGLRRSGWRWTPHLGAHRWTPPLVGRPRCWRTRCGVSFRESELRWSAGRLGFPRDADLSWVTVHPQSHRFPAGGVALPTGDTLHLLNLFFHPHEQVSQKGCYSPVFKTKQQVLLIALLKL